MTATMCDAEDRDTLYNSRLTEMKEIQSSGLYQIFMPSDMDGRTYGELYQSLAQRGIIALGLLRGIFHGSNPDLPYGPNENKNNYVFTNPPKDTILHSCDRIFLLSVKPYEAFQGNLNVKEWVMEIQRQEKVKEMKEMKVDEEKVKDKEKRNEWKAALKLVQAAQFGSRSSGSALGSSDSLDFDLDSTPVSEQLLSLSEQLQHQQNSDPALKELQSNQAELSKKMDSLITISMGGSFSEQPPQKKTSPDPALRVLQNNHAELSKKMDNLINLISRRSSAEIDMDNTEECGEDGKSIADVTPYDPVLDRSSSDRTSLSGSTLYA